MTTLPEVKEAYLNLEQAWLQLAPEIEGRPDSSEHRRTRQDRSKFGAVDAAPFAKTLIPLPNRSARAVWACTSRSKLVSNNRAWSRPDAPKG
jgi:hypothetical protein